MNSLLLLSLVTFLESNQRELLKLYKLPINIQGNSFFLKSVIELCKQLIYCHKVEKQQKNSKNNHSIY